MWALICFASAEDIENAIVTACIIHNMLRVLDGDNFSFQESKGFLIHLGRK
jgi:hypothetical protein